MPPATSTRVTKKFTEIQASTKVDKKARLISDFEQQENQETR
jgi:hypothetical protein